MDCHDRCFGKRSGNQTMETTGRKSSLGKQSVNLNEASLIRVSTSLSSVIKDRTTVWPRRPTVVLFKLETE